jgi:putative endonuclease
MKITGKTLGKWGEEQAQSFLEKNGVKILGKNIHTKYGEIDLLGINESVLLFIEVKTSQTRKFGFPEVSVNAKKMDHMNKAAQKYIQDHEGISSDWRIDVISIELNSKKESEIKWFKNVISE